ncbi:unnamed protein product [Diatraea saccharalis]|uniref:Uncharacterized protein n=1 Tax=Diatraea saccharalis TaxID=40085 RepID=A0A9N9R6B2_9NEOP|nr:unnamed protein product [Diatraea saccharalis]
MIMDGTPRQILFIAIILTINVQRDYTRTTAPTNLLVTRAGPCSTSLDNDTVVKLSEMSVFTRTYDSSVSGWLNISSNINNGWSVKASMEKCQDIRNLDTCDYLKAFSMISNGCEQNSDDDDEQSQLYYMFFRHTHPRMSCPINAGNYRIETFPFQTEDNYIPVSESKISTSMFGYTFKLEGFLEGHKLVCLEAYMQLLYIREYGASTEAPALASLPVEEDSTEEY